MNDAQLATSGMRDRKKRQTREAIEAAAWRLFARKGFDHTTVEDISAAADIAPRTFFRYFETKDAVLFGSWREDLAQFSDLLEKRPPDESPLTALSSALLAILDRLEADAPANAQRSRIANASRQVSDYKREVILPAWEDAMASALARRLDVDPTTDLRPTLYAGVAFAALNAASSVWTASGGVRSLYALLTAAFAELDGSSADALANPATPARVR
jgi:AcrR family transcriptional regulator